MEETRQQSLLKEGHDSDSFSEASNDHTDTVVSPVLTQSQLERIEKNRQKALSLRQSRVVSKPTPTDQDDTREGEKKAETGTKHHLLEDTHGGFFLEEEEEDQPSRKKRLIYDEGMIKNYIKS